MEIIEDGSSSSSTITSSSSTSQTETRKLCALTSTKHSKRKAGRRKLKETTHPVYRGVLLTNESKRVREIHEPSKKSRIWLGTFPTPEMAVRAYDATTLALCGDDSPLNFYDSTLRAESSSPHDIQEAAFGPKLYYNKPSSSLSLKREEEDNEIAFVDEEVLFNMPSFYNSIAEGLVVTPPGMRKGFDWSDDVDCNIMDLTLWK